MPEITYLVFFFEEGPYHGIHRWPLSDLEPFAQGSLMVESQFPWNADTFDIAGIAVNFNPRKLFYIKTGFDHSFNRLGRESSSRQGAVYPVTDLPGSTSRPGMQTGAANKYAFLFIENAKYIVLAHVEFAAHPAYTRYFFFFFLRTFLCPGDPG